MAAKAENFSCYLLPNGKSNWTKTWWKALGQHGNLELLMSFRSDIQDGHHGDNLENLQTAYVPEQYVRLSWKLLGGIGAT